MIGRWSNINQVMLRVKTLWQGVDSGQTPAEDYYDKQAKKTVHGVLPMVRELLRGAGLMGASDPDVGEAWDAYKRLQANSPISGDTVVDHKADGTPITMRECWIRYMLGEALKDLIRRRNGEC